MIHKLKGLLFCFCFHLVTLSHAQILSPEALENVLPLTPNTAALMKFENVPVSIYTGIPNISVPFYTINVDEVSIPIALNYHAGGIRVGEEPSSVGLGWSLSEGGTISRTVRGAADEAFLQGKGYFYHTEHDSVARFAQQYLPPYIHHTIPMTNTEVYFLQKYALGFDLNIGKKDCLPDIFQFNFLGFSGKFYFDVDKKIVLLQNSRIKITSNVLNNRSLQSIRQFVITDENGNQYVFGISRDNQRVAIERSAPSGSFGLATIPDNEPGDYSHPSATAWRLMDIITKHGRNIKFNYTSYLYSKEVKGMHTLKIAGLNLVNVSDCDLVKLNMTRYFREMRLQSIEFDNGSLQLQSVSSPNELFNSIQIFSDRSSVVPIKQMDMAYSYPLLDSVKLSGSSGSNPQVYRFLYNTSMPSYTMDPNSDYSNAQDWWGYYNGKTANNSLVPNIDYSYAVFSCSGDRNVDPAYTQASSLRKMIYPTGGSTEFIYESNRAFVPNMYSKFFPPLKLTRGGSASAVWRRGETIVDTIHIEHAEDKTVGVTKQAIVHYEIVVTPDHSSAPNFYGDDIYIRIENMNGGLIKKITPALGADTVLLPEGFYVVKQAMLNRVYLDTVIARSTIIWNSYPVDTIQATPDGESYVGGLRIKKMITDDGSGNLSTADYIYQLFSDTTKTSGVMANFFSSTVTPYPKLGGGLFLWEYLVNSSGNAPLVSTAGSPVGYKNVTVSYGESGENGKDEFTYTTAKEYPDSNSINEPPYPYPCDYDARRGLLLSKVSYKKAAKDFVPVQAAYSSYKFNVRPKMHLGIVVTNDFSEDDNFIYLDTVYYIPDPFLDIDFFKQYFHIAAVRTSSEFIYKESDSTVQYDQMDPTKYLYSVSKYAYDTLDAPNGDPYYQVISVNTVNSKGETLTTQNKYARHFSGVYDSLDARNIIAPIIEQTQFRKGVQVAQTRNNYLKFSNGLIQPESVELKIGTNPSEKRVEFLKYDAAGNLVQQHKTNDVLNTYIWDYNTLYPTASVVNADSASIACTSFETDAKGHWTFSGSPQADGTAPTGAQVYNLSGGSMTKTLTSTATYMISYWRPVSASPLSISGTQSGYPRTGRTVSGWKYYEHKVTGQTLATLSGSGLIDEVRLYPLNAQVTTYTYTALVGMTSQCDAASHIIYYEYDDFSRLKVIKDQEGNIVKTYEYHYQQ